MAIGKVQVATFLRQVVLNLVCIISNICIVMFCSQLKSTQVLQTQQ